MPQDNWTDTGFAFTHLNFMIGMMFYGEEQFLPCPICQQVNSTHHDVCPKCGHLLHATAIRVRGALAIGLGLALVGGMSYLMAWIADVIRHSADPGATNRFTGSPTQAAGIFAILSFVLLIGVVSIVLGGWMLRYGWRPAKLKRLVWLCGIIFWLLGVVAGVTDLFYGSR
jgi:hypothetical protein